ncbi:uncharacterized protein EV422DRAFT_537974 [Fimicolochytrium jonesii]|uniref:uncharacterized protein n=1 Tax=Fimicolochytrium jonesii TaxID=1396493 RepID=UPI0022FE1D1E|nr:uncharacterized protein EV422DRAFT_537974 [Fimicolochytrium jonesii]KAI8818290.1 hypothetical protein EV422DRAFT_537974 [Fimicolochytrium jonesii]
MDFSDEGQNGLQQDLGQPERDEGGESRKPSPGAAVRGAAVRPGAVRVLKQGKQYRYSAGCIDCRLKSSSRFYRAPWPVLARAEAMGRDFFFGEGATQAIVCGACWTAWRRVGVFQHEEGLGANIMPTTALPPVASCGCPETFIGPEGICRNCQGMFIKISTDTMAWFARNMDVTTGEA